MDTRELTLRCACLTGLPPIQIAVPKQARCLCLKSRMMLLSGCVCVLPVIYHLFIQRPCLFTSAGGKGGERGAHACRDNLYTFLTGDLP
jgi:hypothetical protein